MDLNLLTALDALLATHSVARAAARLSLSAPAVSRALARIREATGDPILVRAGRGLVPTPRAEAIRERVRRTAQEAALLLRPDAPVDLKAVTRVISLRADDAITAVVGPPLIERIRREAPGISLVFRAEDNEDVEALRDGSIDMDVGVQGSLGPELRRRKLLDDERVVLCPARRRRRALTLAELAASEHVDVSRRGARVGPVDRVLARHGLHRRVRAVVPNQLAAAVLVARSDLVSLVSIGFATSIREVLDVDFVPAPLPLHRATVQVVWHPRFDADRGHRWVREQLYDLASSLGLRR